ncbi:MAG: hypothetical protein SFU98_00450 [Leptospiraceae bacterium]|nr:hypothetical protein [Leptospiraceae bacterium]
MEMISVMDLLKEKYGEFLMDSVEDLELYVSEDGLIFSEVTLKNGELGHQKLTLTTIETLVENDKASLREWFQKLSTDYIYFYFDTVFFKYPEHDDDAEEYLAA